MTAWKRSIASVTGRPLSLKLPIHRTIVVRLLAWRPTQVAWNRARLATALATIACLRISEVAHLQACDRDGDYADPHTSEESPRIMARRRGRRARRHAPRTPRAEGGANAAAPEEAANTTTSRLGAAFNAGTRTVTREDGESDNAILRSGPQRLQSRLA